MKVVEVALAEYSANFRGHLLAKMVKEGHEVIALYWLSFFQEPLLLCSSLRASRFCVKRLIFRSEVTKFRTMI